MRALIATAVCGVLLATAPSGCGYGRPLAHRELTVVFRPTFTAADVQRVRRSCDGVGGARARPVARPDSAAGRRYPLRFDVSQLDEAQRRQLTVCLSKDRAVQGYMDSAAQDA